MLTILTLTLISLQPPVTNAATVRISNSHLVATCVAGKPAGKTRRWTLSMPTTFTFTMRNDPRPGAANETPGMATIEFSPEAGHDYEIEVRGDAAAYSLRVWKAGEWRPVVRDRTTDQIVSSAPKWVNSACGQ